MTKREVQVTRSGHRAVLKFSSDHRANVFTLSLLREMKEAIAELRRDKNVRVLIIEGRDDIFSGGADLQSIIDMSASEYRQYVEVEYEVFREIETLPFATVAVLRGGACVGNAAEIALACDFRMAATTVRIGWPEVHVGFLAPSQRLARFVGFAKAKEILLLGRLLDADAALQAGLLTQIGDESSLGAALEELVSDLESRAPVAIEVTKEALERAYDFPAENPSLEIEGAFRSYSTEDFREGATAILEKRAPVFRGL